METVTTSLPVPGTASLLFSEVLAEFQNDKKDKSFSRQENLRYGLRHLEAYLHLHGIKVLGEITHHALRGYKLYLKGRGLSAVSVNDYMTMARTFFVWCVRQELIETNPTSRWDRTPEPRREIEVLERTEVLAMLGVAKDAKVGWLGLRDYWMIRTLYGCGLRASEVCRLRTTDVDTLKNRYRIIGKGPGGADREQGGKERYVPFSLEVRRAYLAYLRVRPKVDHDFVLTTLEGMPFVSRGKNRNGPSRMLHLVQAIARRAGITRDVHPHLFRHTFATEYLRANPKQIETLRDLLGHASYKQVREYLHLVERQQRLEMVGTLPDTLL